MKLQHKIATTIIIMLICIVWGIGIVTLKIMNVTIDKQNESTVMDMAYSIATMEEIQKALSQGNTLTIQDKIEDIRKNTRVQYIIVLDMKKIRYSYPNEYGIGKEYMGIGADEVLSNGKPELIKDENQFISAIWGAVPIFYDNKQVGAVLIGLLDDAVKSEISMYHFFIYLSIVIALIIGSFAAWLLAKSIKNTIFGLEPKEISLLLGERDLILHSLKYGILEVDHNQNIQFYNSAAAHILENNYDLKGKNLKEVSENLYYDLLEAIKIERTLYNQEVRINPNKTVLCSYKVLTNSKRDNNEILISFQDLTEVKELAEELTDIKKVTDALRAQSHEFSNKLYTISGLIQLEEYDKALGYITEISSDRKKVSQVLNNNIKFPHLSAILLAKSNRATEAKILMEIDKNSNLNKIPEGISIDDICSIVGNLIENSIEALVGNDNGQIYFKILSDENNLKIVVKDNGPGINIDIRENIFKKGFTTKKGNRGYGLNIIKSIVYSVEGKIKLICNNGTQWEISIPMKREEL